MTRKKNGFLTFICSLLPGAGEMYMGFMKQGISLMGAFFLLVCLSTWLNLGPLLFVAPILWFYSFFHVHNLRGMSDEEFYAIEDDYLFHLNSIMPEQGKMNKRFRNVLAAVLIVVGAVVLLNNFLDLVAWLLPSYLMGFYSSLLYVLPQLVIAVLCVLGGIWLIRGKKKELEHEDVTGGEQP